jgi:phosphomannomutase
MIKFGTDGWRGVIAQDFTFTNVRLVSQAIADYFASEQEPQILVGYDSRFLASEFAAAAAEVLAANGIKVLFSCSFAPTPVFSYYTAKKNLAGAIIITASHNPAKYNGLKVKTRAGESAGPQLTKQFEERVKKLSKQDVKQDSFATALKAKQIQVIDPLPLYLNLLKSFVTVDLSRLKVVVDPLYGASQRFFAQFLTAQGVQVIEIHNSHDVTFGGLNPEPIEPHIDSLKREVVANKAHLGLAFDGDGDRIGAVDEGGNFVNAHQIFALLLRYLVEELNLTGTVVKTVSTTRMIDSLAYRYGLELVETPIGFKYIAQQFQTKDVLIGGEESGGLAFKNHLPERDGLLSGLLLLQAVKKAQKPLSVLVKELAKLTGPAHYGRLDLQFNHISPAALNQFLHKEKFSLPLKVKEVKDIDGFKCIFTDASWLMIRPSGTEPIVRVYAEADSRAKLKQLLSYGEGLVKKFQEG